MAEKKQKRESWKEYLAKVDTPRLKKLRKLSFWGFAAFYCALIVALVIAGGRFMEYCSESFILYENSQLELTVNAVMDQLNSADGAALQTMLASSMPLGGPFDDVQAVYDAKYDVLADMQLTCRKIKGYTPDKHGYNLYADGRAVGSFEITSVGEESRLGLLTITQWQFAGGQVSFEYESYGRSCIVPEGFTVLINGKPLGEEYIVGEIKPISAFKYVSEYVDMPGMVTYEVAGLLAEPQLTILDNNGNEVETDPEVEHITLAETFLPAQMPEDLEGMAIEAAKLWANYSLKDATLQDVETVLIKDSFLHKQVKASNSERRWIERHVLKGYENEQILEFISYGENCFSCRICMERTIHVEMTQELLTDRLDNIFYFVRLDTTDDGIDNPQWYIVDMRTA